MLRGVVAEQVEIGVGHVGLEADRLGHVDGFEQIDHVAPGVHAGPANFAFGGQAFAVIAGDFRRLREMFRRFFACCLGDRRTTASDYRPSRCG